MKSRWLAAWVLSCGLPVCVAWAGASSEAPLEGPTSVYTALLTQAARAWPPAGLKHPPRDAINPARLTCLTTPGNARFVGVEQAMWIEAPLERVATVIEDFEHYKDLSPGFEDIRIVSRAGSRVVTYWEKRIPLFFVPNLRYEATFAWGSPARTMKAYRFQLLRSDDLRSLDGLIVIEFLGAGPVRFTRYDFIDPTRGVFKSVPPGRIWRNTLEDVFVSDVGFKLKAENPGWSHGRVVKAALDLLERFPVSYEPERCRRFAPTDKRG